MQIKTLAEILAESEPDSASSSVSKRKKDDESIKHDRSIPPESRVKHPYSKRHQSSKVYDNNDASAYDSSSFGSFESDSFKPDLLKTEKPKSKKLQKRFHPAASFTPKANDAPTYQNPEPQSIQEMLAEVKREVHGQDCHTELTEHAININAHSESEAQNKDADNLPSALKAYLRSPEQRQAETDAIKAESRLRWLAFYYLSRREYGKAELKQKLLDKEQDPDRIDALLDEFESKGYQSDYRTTLMLIRESIRKGRGRGHIKQAFYRKKIAAPSNIDELIDMANAESDEFREFVNDDEDSLVEGVDWLKLAVTTRSKKYGNEIPTEQKDKARQLRFLQYRGFNTDICFQALNYTLETLDERF